jgi:hypothetical protein
VFLPQRARSPSEEDSVPQKRQSRRKAKPSDSDADYAANDSEDDDELADETEEATEMAASQSSPLARSDEEEDKEEEEEQQEEPEASPTLPKKAAKGAATGKAKAAPAAAPVAPISPLFAGPRKFSFRLFRPTDRSPKLLILKPSKTCLSSGSGTTSLLRPLNRLSSIKAPQRVRIVSPAGTTVSPPRSDVRTAARAAKMATWCARTGAPLLSYSCPLNDFVLSWLLRLPVRCLCPSSYLLLTFPLF